MYAITYTKESTRNPRRLEIKMRMEENVSNYICIYVLGFNCLYDTAAPPTESWTKPSLFQFTESIMAYIRPIPTPLSITLIIMFNVIGINL